MDLVPYSKLSIARDLSIDSSLRQPASQKKEVTSPGVKSVFNRIRNKLQSTCHDRTGAKVQKLDLTIQSRKSQNIQPSRIEISDCASPSSKATPSLTAVLSGDLSPNSPNKTIKSSAIKRFVDKAVPQNSPKKFQRRRTC